MYIIYKKMIGNSFLLEEMSSWFYLQRYFNMILFIKE